MLWEMARVVRPDGTVTITDEVEHPYKRMREEHADVWLGFSRDEVEDFFRRLLQGGLVGFGYESLGTQGCTRSTGSNELADIKIFAAWGAVPVEDPG